MCSIHRFSFTSHSNPVGKIGNKGLQARFLDQEIEVQKDPVICSWPHSW